MICRPKKGVGGIDPYYLLLFLRSNAGYEAIQKCIRGQSGHIYSAEVKMIQIPKPTKEQAEQIDDALKALRFSLKARISSFGKDAESKQGIAPAIPIQRA